MTTSEPTIMTKPAYIYFAYVLFYQYELAQFIDLFTDKAKAFERLCELSKGCIITVANTTCHQ